MNTYKVRMELDISASSREMAADLAEDIRELIAEETFDDSFVERVIIAEPYRIIEEVGE